MPHTDCSTGTRDQFSEEIATLFHKSKGLDSIAVAGHFNAHVGKLGVSEASSGGCCGLLAQGTDEEDRLFQFCTDNRLFLSGTSFRYSSRHSDTTLTPQLG